MAAKDPILSEDAQYRMLVEQVRDYGIFLLDPEGRVSTWNEGARRLKGYEAEEILGRHFTVFYTPEDVASGKPSRELAEALRSGRSEDEGWRLRKDGSSFWANVVITPLRDPSGALSGYAKVTRDFSARKQLEEELLGKNERLREENSRAEAANRAKSSFLANMSHELRTPLNSIIGFTEIIHDGRAGAVSVDQKEFLGDVLASARHLLQLISDILDLSKVEAGKIQFSLGPVEIPALLEQAANMLRIQAEKRRILVVVEAGCGVAGVVSDGDRLRQVVFNFLSNAIKFSHEGGEVRLRALPEGRDHYRLEVEDFGLGIAEEDQSRLFNEFVQLDQDSNKKHAGTGLGLSLSKKIVELLGGQVGLRSRPGSGSAFFAVLPLKAQAKPQL
jgi:PAS domain S-box-containing protein